MCKTIATGLAFSFIAMAAVKIEKTDFKGWRRGIAGPRVGATDAVHAGLPDAIHVSGEAAQIVVDERPLQQIGGVGVCLEVIQQLAQGAGDKQNVTIHTQHEVRGSFAENHIAHRGALAKVERDIAVAGHPILEGLQFLGAGPVRVIIHYDEFEFAGDFGVEEADGLDGEVDAVVVVVGGHADGQGFAGCGVVFNRHA